MAAYDPSSVKVGQKYRLKAHIGHDADKAAREAILHQPGLIGQDGWHPSTLHPLLKGWVGEVVHVSPAGESGAGPTDAETVVLSFPHHDYDFSDPANPSGTPHETARRHVSFTHPQMAELQLVDDSE